VTIGLIVFAVLAGTLVLSLILKALRDRKFRAKKWPSKFIPETGPRAIHRTIGISPSAVPLRVRAYLALERCGANNLIEASDSSIVGWTDPTILEFLVPVYRDPLEYAAWIPDNDATSCKISCCFR
jgi:hypothetical protein